MTRTERLLYDVLFDSLLAWEGEEASVQDEHAALIKRIRRTVDNVQRRDLSQRAARKAELDRQVRDLRTRAAARKGNR